MSAPLRPSDLLNDWSTVLPMSPVNIQDVAHLVSLGFSADTAHRALIQTRGDVNAAFEVAWHEIHGPDPNAHCPICARQQAVALFRQRTSSSSRAASNTSGTPSSTHSYNSVRPAITTTAAPTQAASVYPSPAPQHMQRLSSSPYQQPTVSSPFAQPAAPSPYQQPVASSPYQQSMAPSPYPQPMALSPHPAHYPLPISRDGSLDVPASNTSVAGASPATYPVSPGFGTSPVVASPLVATPYSTPMLYPDTYAGSYTTTSPMVSASLNASPIPLTPEGGLLSQVQPMQPLPPTETAPEFDPTMAPEATDDFDFMNAFVDFDNFEAPFSMDVDPVYALDPQPPHDDYFNALNTAALNDFGAPIGMMQVPYPDNHQTRVPSSKRKVASMDAAEALEWQRTLDVWRAVNG